MESAGEKETTERTGYKHPENAIVVHPENSRFFGTFGIFGGHTPCACSLAIDRNPSPAEGGEVLRDLSPEHADLFADRAHLGEKSDAPSV
jgi:hypothetical protein